MATQHREVALSYGWKLVVIQNEGALCLRIRAYQDGAWSFITPPLALTPDQAAGLARDEEGDVGYPVDLQHERMDGKLNLMSYRGQLFAHFQGLQRSGTVREFRAALEEVR